MTKISTKNNRLSVGIGSFKDRSMAGISRLKRAVMISLFSSVIKDTPVGTSDPKRGYTGGRLRGNWTFTVDQPQQTRQVDFADPTSRVTSLVQEKVTEADGSVFLTNNMPYAGRIEYDGHSHTKAPQGMVRKNLIRIARNLRNQAAKESASS